MEKIRLSESAYQDLLHGERELLSALPDVDNAEECGIDCKEIRSLLEQKLDQTRKIKQRFAPIPPHE